MFFIILIKKLTSISIIKSNKILFKFLSKLKSMIANVCGKNSNKEVTYILLEFELTNRRF
jgi:hypothetical protein